MPPTTRGVPASFIAVFVEDLVAKLWTIEMDSGAADEIARFSVEGMNRPQILDLARTFALARINRRSVISDLTLEPPRPEDFTAAEGKPAATKSHSSKKASAKKRAHRPYDPEIRNKQMARQAELYEALLKKGGNGTTSRDLAAELKRGGPQNVGVSLAVLQKQGKAIQVDGIWYAVANGNIPPPPK